METSLNHFQSSFEASSGPQYSSLPAWVEEVMPHPEITSNFDMSLVTPGLIGKTLRKLPNMSAPGPDKISYLHLKKLPSTHHFLTTLYFKIILKSPHAPTLWCKGELRLVHERGDPGIPANFRPIALTLTIGKLPQNHSLTSRTISAEQWHYRLKSTKRFPLRNCWRF